MADINIQVDINSAIRNIGKLDDAFEGINLGAKRADSSVDDLSSGINRAGRNVDDFGKESVQAFAQVEGGLDSVGVGGIAMGNILADVFSEILQVASQLPGQIYELATSAEETGSKFRTVLGPAVEESSQFLDEFANKAGLSEVAGQELVSRTAAIAQGFGFAQQESAGFAEEVVRLSGDLTSFNDVPIEQSSNAVITALSGEREALKTLGIVIRETDVQQKALAQTGKESADTLTQQEKATATLALITERAGAAVGDLDRTQDSAANRGRRLSAQLEDVATSIAERLLPAINTIQGLLVDFSNTDFFNSLVEGAVNTAQKISNLVRIFAANFEVITKIFGSITAAALAYRLSLQLITTWQALSAAGAISFSSALRAVRGALISTGIGAIIVALGTLVGVLSTSEEAWAGFKRMVMGVVDLFQNVFTNLPTIVGAVFDLVIARIVQFGFEAYDSISEFITDTIDAIPAFLEGVYDFFKSLLDGVVDLFESGVQIVKDFFANPLDFDLANYATAGFNAGKAFAEGFIPEARTTEEAVNRTKVAAENLAKVLAETGVTGSANEVAAGAGQFGSGFMNAFSSGGGAGQPGQATGEGDSGVQPVAGMSDEEMEQGIGGIGQQLSAEDQAFLAAEEEKTAKLLEEIEKRNQAKDEAAREQQELMRKQEQAQIASMKAQTNAIIQGVNSQVTSVKEAGEQMLNSIRQQARAKLSTWVNEAVAGAVSKTLASAPWPINVGLAAAAGVATKVAFNNLVPEFATGVTNFEGGTALVGEEGPELVNLPQGANVLTNENTNKIMRSIQSAQGINVSDAGFENSEQIAQQAASANQGMNMMREPQGRQRVDVDVRDIEIEGDKLRIVLQNNSEVRKEAGIS